MILIREEVLELQTLTEAVDGKKNLYIEGIYMQANKLNKNRRVYPKEILQRECYRYIKENVNANRAFGELGHPDTPKINEDRISHLIVDLREDGNNWIGKARILDTDKGRIAKGIVEGGGQLAASSRALGSLKESGDGSSIVQGDLRLMTAADIVIDPSAPDAFVHGIMEGVEWIFENGNWSAVSNQRAYDYMKSAKNQKDWESKALVLIENYFSKLARI